MGNKKSEFLAQFFSDSSQTFFGLAHGNRSHFELMRAFGKVWVISKILGKVLKSLWIGLKKEVLGKV